MPPKGRKATQKKSADSKTAEQKVRFDFIKSGLFRTVHPDGAFGGLSPQGGIFAALYTQRQPIPRSVVNELTPEGNVGAEIRDMRQAREGIVREVEFGVEFSHSVAKAFHTWLGEKINELESRQKKQAKK